MGFVCSYYSLECFEVLSNGAFTKEIDNGILCNYHMLVVCCFLIERKISIEILSVIIYCCFGEKQGATLLRRYADVDNMVLARDHTLSLCLIFRFLVSTKRKKATRPASRFKRSFRFIEVKHKL